MSTILQQFFKQNIQIFGGILDLRRVHPRQFGQFHFRIQPLQAPQQPHRQHGKTGLAAHIAILLFYGSALRCIMNALINGSGNYKINFATAILDGIVMRIGLALLFGLALDMKHYGFWLGDALAGFTPFWIGLVFYYSGRWKNTKT